MNPGESERHSFIIARLRRKEGKNRFWFEMPSYTWLRACMCASSGHDEVPKAGKVDLPLPAQFLALCLNIMFKNRALIHRWMMQTLLFILGFILDTRSSKGPQNLKKKSDLIYILERTLHHVSHRRNDEVFLLLLADFGRGFFYPTRWQRTAETKPA